MEISTTIDLGHVAQELGLAAYKVRAAVELLDDGNTVPFITRYRKDQTGGLDEEQIRKIQERVARHRTLAERKQTILKSLESRGKLTEDLAKKIMSASSVGRLEDIYLPFKPKKQTLADAARQRGLEPLAAEVLNADPAAADLRARAEQFLNAEIGLPGVDEVLQGVRHLIAERFHENVELRDVLRRMFKDTSRLVSTRDEAAEQHVEPEEHGEAEHGEAEHAEQVPAEHKEAEHAEAEPANIVADESVADESVADESVADESVAEESVAEELATGDEVAAEASEDSATAPVDAAAEPVPVPTDAAASDAADLPAETPVVESADPGPAVAAATPTAETLAAPPAPAAMSAVARATITIRAPGLTSRAAAKKMTLRQLAAQNRKEAKRKQRERKIASFKDYFHYSEPLNKVPPHRLLAINRGERSKILKVKTEANVERLLHKCEETLVPAEHPHAEFLRGCVRDSLSRLILPGLDREVRRDMTDKAELHAVQVFIQNLRQLLLQPPVHNLRVLAIDPGFRSGCKVAALDEYSMVLGHTVIHVIGKEEIVRQGREQIVEMVRLYHIPVIAIGNGTACRETEQFIADIISRELADLDVKYVIVNEAGASVYSTSAMSREELPGFDPVLRSAVSIGRRLQDPLSELVKINPANIGVGMYQHDVKAKHLLDSLDSVVESCVNFVGVDVNTASPSLLRYISGMNQLTARRLYEHRQKNGPFRSREELKQVAGIGDATFTQAAGFLKITGGDNPLDATWIHPESYAVAQRVIEQLGGQVSDLTLAAKSTAVRNGPKPAAEVATPETGDAVSNEGKNGTDATDVIAAPAEESAVPAAEPQPVAAAPESPAPPPAAAPQPTLAERARAADVQKLAVELGIGEHLLRDILNSLTRPGRDPREDLPPPVFRREVMKLEDLQPGMELKGTVLNVVDFGAFVDIGLSDSGLVHISRLADRFVRDPHSIVSVGDVLTVWVVDVDRQRRRVSLTAIKPGTETPPEKRAERNREHQPSPSPEQGGQQQPQQQRPPRRFERKPRPSQQQQQSTSQSPPPAQQGQRGGSVSPGGQQQSRPPRPQQGQQGQRGGRPPKPPAPVKPITKAMAEGREPLRSFSDLLQFMEKKPPDKPEDKKN